MSIRAIDTSFVIKITIIKMKNRILIAFSEVKELCDAYNVVTVERYDEISSYHDIREQLNRLTEEFRSFLTRPEYLVPFLQPGRLVKVCIRVRFSTTYRRTFDVTHFYIAHIAGEKRVRNV